MLLSSDPSWFLLLNKMCSVIYNACVIYNSRYRRNWRKKSIRNFSKVICYSDISVFKEGDDCS